MRPLRPHQPYQPARRAAAQARLADRRRRFPFQQRANSDVFLGRHGAPLENAAATDPEITLNRGRTAMRLSSWLRMLTGRQHTIQRQGTRQRTRRRLELEALETRTLLSGTTFLPVATASIQDQPLDGQGDSFNTVFDGLLRQSTPLSM